MRKSRKAVFIPGVILLSALAAFLWSCADGSLDGGSCKQGIPVLDESMMIAEYMEKNGDPTKCQDVCIKADELSSLLGSNIHIIDLRSGPEYKSLHIPSAVNVPVEKLEFHLTRTHKAMMFNKIIFVCADGLTSAYAASLMRQFGFDNTHVLEWGMAGWNKATAGKWIQATDSPSSIVKITREESSPKEEFQSPVIRTGKLWREEILHERVKAILKTGFRGVGVGPEALTDPKAMVVAYCSREDYERGHPAGAVHFEPGKSLQLSTGLKHLPPDRPIILYSRNSFEAAYASAYLRTLGYDAKVLMYGMNNFLSQTEMGEGQLFRLGSIPNYTLLGKDVGKMNFQSNAAPKTEKATTKEGAKTTPKTIEMKPKPQETESEGC